MVHGSQQDCSWDVFFPEPGMFCNTLLNLLETRKNQVEVRDLFQLEPFSGSILNFRSVSGLKKGLLPT